MRVKKYQQAFLAPLPGNGCCSYLRTLFARVFFLLPFLLSLLLFYPYTMSHPSIHQLSTSEDEFSEPSTSSRPFTTPGFKFHPRVIAMVRAQTFSGLKIEDPDLHLQVFEELCSCLVIPSMSQESLRWKLFPFSLIAKTEQWYTHNVGDEMVIGKSSEMTFVSRSLPYPMKHLDEVTSLHLNN